MKSNNLVEIQSLRGNETLLTDWIWETNECLNRALMNIKLLEEDLIDITKSKDLLRIYEDLLKVARDFSENI